MQGAVIIQAASFACGAAFLLASTTTAPVAKSGADRMRAGIHLDLAFRCVLGRSNRYRCHPPGNHRLHVTLGASGAWSVHRWSSVMPSGTQLVNTTIL